MSLKTESLENFFLHVVEVELKTHHRFIDRIGRLVGENTG